MAKKCIQFFKMQFVPWKLFDFNQHFSALCFFYFLFIYFFFLLGGGGGGGVSNWQYVDVVAWSHQAITWTNVDQDSWHNHMASMMTSSNGNIFRITGHLCGEFTGPGEFPTQRPVTRSFGVFFDLRPNRRLSKHRWGWWFEMPSCPLWRHCNDTGPP